MTAEFIKEITLALQKTGSTIPAHRARFKKGYSFSTLPFHEQVKIWDAIWHTSASFRIQFQAYLFLEKHVPKKELRKDIWKTAVKWQQLVNDWPLCDALSMIYTKVLEDHTDEVYAQLVKWNKSKNLWHRRQSLVSLLYYSRTKKAYLPFEKITAHIEPLLQDEEYYVQKGIGWALRELYNVYPTKALAFMKEHIKSISSIAFTAATEKMIPSEKNVLKEMRKTKF